jgi:hypothetical protein
MSQSYIPSQESAALTWMQVFAAAILANPGLYGLTAADAAAIVNAVNAFVAAYALAADPATRTPVIVAAKDDCRNSAEQICRQYAMGIKVNAGISDPDKIAIGVRPVNTSRSQRHVPDTSPLLNILAATPGSQTVRYADTMSPETGAKPFGADQLQLFVTVAPEATDDADAARFYGTFTTNPIGVGFDSADDGKVATYFARWASRKGDTGPWSLPVSMRIAA